MPNLTLQNIEQDIQRSVSLALEEDVGSGDVTAELIPPQQRNSAVVITRENGVLCGCAWFDEVFRQLGDVTTTWHAKDGDAVSANTKLVTLSGNTRQILTGERCALNFLQLLSGTATKARQYAEAVTGCDIKILDTRKTLPGLRTAQKYAVNVGGCHNHRIGLYDAFLIKENHIAACGGIAAAIQQAKTNHPELPVEVEVESLEELRQAIDAKADIVMLDNFSQQDTEQAVKLGKGKVLLEISGGVQLGDLNSLRGIAVDFVSIGELTKSNVAMDLSLRLLK